MLPFVIALAGEESPLPLAADLDHTLQMFTHGTPDLQISVEKLTHCFFPFNHDTSWAASAVKVSMTQDGINALSVAVHNHSVLGLKRSQWLFPHPDFVASQKGKGTPDDSRSVYAVEITTSTLNPKTELARVESLVVCDGHSTEVVVDNPVERFVAMAAAGCVFIGRNVWKFTIPYIAEQLSPGARTRFLDDVSSRCTVVDTTVLRKLGVVPDSFRPPDAAAPVTESVERMYVFSEIVDDVIVPLAQMCGVSGSAVCDVGQMTCGLLASVVAEAGDNIYSHVRLGNEGPLVVDRRRPEYVTALCAMVERTNVSWETVKETKQPGAIGLVLTVLGNRWVVQTPMGVLPRMLSRLSPIDARFKTPMMTYLLKSTVLLSDVAK